jgi:hypothetical protein
MTKDEGQMTKEIRMFEFGYAVDLPEGRTPSNLKVELQPGSPSNGLEFTLQRAEEPGARPYFLNGNDGTGAGWNSRTFGFRHSFDIRHSSFVIRVLKWLREEIGLASERARSGSGEK